MERETRAADLGLSHRGSEREGNLCLFWHVGVLARLGPTVLPFPERHRGERLWPIICSGECILTEISVKLGSNQNTRWLSP